MHPLTHERYYVNLFLFQVVQLLLGNYHWLGLLCISILSCVAIKLRWLLLCEEVFGVPQLVLWWLWITYEIQTVHTKHMKGLVSGFTIVFTLTVVLTLKWDRWLPRWVSLYRLSIHQSLKQCAWVVPRLRFLTLSRLLKKSCKSAH